MKKAQKVVLSIFVVALVAILSIGGTIAYLTSKDSDVNVMTLGNVKIVQNEQDRTGAEFKQGQALLPIVKPTTVKDEAGYPADANYIDKIVTVTNTGLNDAYVRTLIAIPKTSYEGQDGENAGANVIHWQAYPQGWTSNPATLIPGTDKNVVNNWSYGKDETNVWPGNYGDWNSFTATINGKEYSVYVATNLEIVKPGETTAPNMTGLYLDSRVDFDGENYTLDGKVITGLDTQVEVLVFSQAVQASGFDNAYQALNTAFGVPSSTNHPWANGVVIPTVVSTTEELATALENGESVMLKSDLTLAGEETLTIADEAVVEINLNGKTLTNAVVGGAAIENNGSLTITGDGSIVNGTNNTKASHTIVNKGTLVIESGNIGSEDTAGAAVVNYGTTTINGGTFASKQENSKGDGLCAYAFINQAGTMIINNATLNGQTHGLFGAYGGEIVVNGGNYTLDGNGGLGCYLVYATGAGKVTLNGGTYNTNEPRSSRVFFVYDNGNYFNADAIATGKVVVNDGATIYLDGVEQNY